VPRPRPIPRRLFQTLALASLVIVWGTAGQLAWSRSWPVSSLTAAFGTALGILVTWVLASVVWMILILPFRLYTDFPTLDQTLAARGARDFSHALDLERGRLAADARGTPAQRRRYRLTMAGVGAVLAIACGVGSAVNLELAPESFLLAPPLLAIGLGLFAVWNLLRAIAGR
jgi:hypothetical protein